MERVKFFNDLKGKYMRLGIISDVHHYYDQNGQLCTLSLVAQQFEQWAMLFDQVIVCAPLMSGFPPITHRPYSAPNIRLMPIPLAGGNSFGAKLDLASKLTTWWNVLSKLIEHVDAIHIRCPNNISILGLLALVRSRCLRQAVYTGQWQGYPGEPLTYRWQRWFLRHWFRGPVAVYGDWSRQPAHIVPSFSPSYHMADWEMENETMLARLERLRSYASLPHPIKLMTVGSLNRNKNQQLIIRAVRALREMQIDVELHILGDGTARADLEQLAVSLDIAERIHFHGNVAHEQVRYFYRTADFVIQAPYAEGYGKVPIEAFFHGAIPILSDVNLSAELVGGTLRGRTFPQGDHMRIAEIIAELANNPVQMAAMIEQGRDYAKTLTLESWRQHIKTMLELFWRDDLFATA
jgi:glycosyltransferase involved in cell wall biosynthesis